MKVFFFFVLLVVQTTSKAEVAIQDGLYLLVSRFWSQEFIEVFRPHVFMEVKGDEMTMSFMERVRF
jgi:hypothetical protein